MKPQPGVTPLAPLLSPLSPGVDVKQEVEAKNGIRNAMEQDNEEEDGEVHEEEEDEAQPYCQPRHRPFPPIEEFDRKYMAKLQVKRIISFSSLFHFGIDSDFYTFLQTINAAINDPHTGQEQLNRIVDLILDTGKQYFKA